MQIPYLLPRRGQNKPPGIPRINWSHPIARGLVSYCYDTGGGVAIDLVTGSVGTQVKTATNTAIGIATSAVGQGWQYAAQGGTAGTETNHLEFRNSTITDNLANAAYSAACGFIPTANSTSALDSAIWAIGDSAQDVHFAIGIFNSPPLNPEVSFANGVFIVETPTIALNQYTTIAMNQPTGTTGNIYTVQGSTFSKIAETPGAFASLTGQTPMFGEAEQGSATSGHFCNYNGFIFYGAAWKRVIADEEVRSLHDNPWQFLIFPEDEIFATLVGAAAGPVVLGPDRWMPQFSEPVRQKPGLGAQLQSFASSFVFTPGVVFEFIGPDKYMQRLSEPVRSKPNLGASQPFSSSFLFTPGVVFEFIGPDKYMQALSEPQRQKLGLGSPEQQAFAWSNFTPAAAVTPTFGWFTGLSEPVRKPHLLEGAQQFFAIDPSVIPVSQLWWFSPLSEPVRRLRGLDASAQPFFAFEPTLLPIFGWYEALSEPVRLLPALRASLQQAALAFDPNPFPPSFGWYEALSNPVRFARLSPALAPFEAFLFPLPPPVPVNFWYQPLSEPQRNKLSLLTALQEAWVGPPRLLPTFMFAVMNAVEQFDTFLGGGTAFNTPASAEIGIVFNPYPTVQVGVSQPTIASVSISIAAPSS